MALNNFKCNHLMPLHFKGLKVKITYCRTRDKSLTESSFKLGEHHLVRYSFAAFILVHNLGFLTDFLHKTSPIQSAVFTADICK